MDAETMVIIPLSKLRKLIHSSMDLAELRIYKQRKKYSVNDPVEKKLIERNTRPAINLILLCRELMGQVGIERD